MPYLTVNSKKLHYADSHALESEPPSSPLTIILVHGLGSSQNYYAPVLPSLSPKYRCITFDTYGNARSKFDGKEHTVQTIAADVVGILDALEIREKVVVVGHSMGGMTVTELASTRPERVKGGVCIGPVHPQPSVAEIFRGRIETVQKDGMEPVANMIPKSATGSKATALHRGYIREILLGQEVDGYVANCRVIEQAKPPAYEKVKAPILILAGREDKSAPLEGYIHDNLGSSNKKLKIMEGVGHWHCIEAGVEVGNLIARFCESL